jgi:hypothetical protein
MAGERVPKERERERFIRGKNLKPAYTVPETEER